MQLIIIILLTFFILNGSAASADAQLKGGNELAFTASCVKEGLGVKLNGNKITISPGQLYLEDKLVNVDQEVTLDIPPGKVATGKEPPDATHRMDTIVVDGTGKITLLQGQRSVSGCVPPEPGPNQLALAHVYSGPGNAKIQPTDFMPIVSIEGPLMAVPVHQHNVQALKKTLQKLQNGETVNIVFWGDSITAGAGSSDTAHRWADMVAAGLRKSYPKAHLVITNAGIGGTNTKGRLPAVEKEVFAFNPDLVIIEFINDVFLKDEEFPVLYNAIMEKSREHGAEILFVNPGLPAPKLLKMTNYGQIAKMPFYVFMRKFALANNSALAEVESRWEHIDREGLRPDLLLIDAVIHPNDLGHRIYAEEALKCLQ